MESQYSFDFAFSFAGEDRKVARSLKQALTALGYAVFLDEDYRVHFIGQRLDELLPRYYREARYFVPIISKHYVNKDWPRFEWDIALSERSKRNEVYTLPLRLDDTPIKGLSSDYVYVDLRSTPIDEVISVLSQKAGVPRGYSITEKWIATFSINVFEAQHARKFPPDAPVSYPHLCDWLTKRLLDSLQKRGGPHVEYAEDARNGETLSVRVMFDWKSDADPIDLDSVDGWWDLLELLPYESVYGQ